MNNFEKGIDSFKISNNVFKNLKRITNLNEEERTDGAVTMLRHLFNQERDANEYWYTLKRLIRGCGSSTTESRSIFFTCLVGFLNFSSDECLSYDQILKIAKTELCSKPAIASKEDSDAVTGMILICGALLRSKKHVILSGDNIRDLTMALFSFSKCKSYHEALAYIFCVELVKVLSEEQFIKYGYPTIKKEIDQCEKFNIGLMFLMIEIVKQYPNLDIVSELRTAIEKLATQNNFDDITSSLLNNRIQNCEMLPILDVVCNFLANCNFLKLLWQQSIESHLNNSTKSIESCILKIATIIFGKSTNELSYMLSGKFLELFLNGLKSKKEEKVQQIYNNFADALSTYCSKSETTNMEKLNIIKKIILYPGMLNVEKFTSQRIIHQIISKCDESSFIDLYNIYKQVFLNKYLNDEIDKSGNWSNVERIHAGNMMQYLLNHKVMQSSYKWRQQEMRSIMVLGFFHADDTQNIIESSKNNDIISKQLADQMKKIFFCSLQNKFSSLENENKLLYYLVQTCNEVLNKKNYDKFFRFNVKENLINIWNEMFGEIQKLKSSKSTKRDGKLDYVFNILLMHMGLQLFKESEMAETAIVDLKICLKKSKEKTQKKQKIEENLSNYEEPDWIEVVVDLILHLLSQNSNSLRNIIRIVFPHLCESITLSSMNQILEMLIMKNELNSLANQDDDDSSAIEKENNPYDGTSSENSDNENAANSSEDSSDSENSNFEENFSEEPTEAEKLKSAISQALIKNNLDNDADSIDLDEMSETEGAKLDEILTEVFKMKKNNIKSRRSKDYRTESTALMHFRIRVLDLIDMYIQNKPALLIVLEIIISLLNTFKHYTNAEFAPFYQKVQNILHKITSLKQFSTVEEVDNLFNYFTKILHTKFKAVEKEQSAIHCKCVLFVINLNKILKEENFDKKVISELQSCVEDFLKSKNAKLNTDFLKYLFQGNWFRVCKLAITLIDISLDPVVKSYKRIQILDFLELLYKNNKIWKVNNESKDKYFKKIETKFEAYLEYFLDKNLSSKEFNKLINCILIITNCHEKNHSEIGFNINNLCENVQTLRKTINLESSHNYMKFCSNYNLKPLTNKSDLELNVPNNKRKGLEKQQDVTKIKKAKV
ncbi:myb-binding protein 1A [Condylostylus longicornis]|uniref:myb-binding protein 1A n=1 Tax=Condylostylus longicornis TaxID=2530218 RepID=UPI00244E0274|nr:myb-binding protein 1A [Condylostylus longicornis]